MRIWGHGMALLEAKKLNVFYGDIGIISDLSLEVEDGEMVSVVGSNGAGKTTLLRTLSGLIHPASGEIWFNGERIDSLPSHQVTRKGLVHVPEGKQLWPYMTVGDHLEVGSYRHEARQHRTDNLELVMELFPILKDKLKQFAHTLSGGEQQMLATARGLMAQPKLLMMDEPSLGLAPLLVEAVFTVIQHLNAQGTTILLVEQNLQQALNIASRGYVLENGIIAMAGTGEELLNSPKLKEAYLGI